MMPVAVTRTRIEKKETQRAQRRVVAWLVSAHVVQRCGQGRGTQASQSQSAVDTAHDSRGVRNEQRLCASQRRHSAVPGTTPGCRTVPLLLLLTPLVLFIEKSRNSGTHCRSSRNQGRWSCPRHTVSWFQSALAGTHTRLLHSCSPHTLLLIRYKVQVDVLKQLGDKLERQLQVQERQLESLPRTEAAKKRATHIKLARDFRRVEATFKNVQLETRRKRARLTEQRTQEEQQARVGAGDQEDDLQRQLQQEDVREDVCRVRAVYDVYRKFKTHHHVSCVLLLGSCFMRRL